MASSGINIFVMVFSIAVLLLCVWQVSCTESPSEDEQQYADYDDNSNVMKRHLGSVAAYSGVRNFGRPNSFVVSSNDDNYKYKRFLGSLARGGWFPRQFRGFVQTGPSFQKRHIGSVARTGWLPYGRTREQDDQYF